MSGCSTTTISDKHLQFDKTPNEMRIDHFNIYTPTVNNELKACYYGYLSSPRRVGGRRCPGRGAVTPIHKEAYLDASAMADVKV